MDEPTEFGWSSYRAEYDDQYIRYERHDTGGRWRARTLDGNTWYFGIGHSDSGEGQTLDTNPPPAALIVDAASGQAHDLQDRQPLTRMVDPFGNTVRYFWDVDVDTGSGWAEELRLSSIRYTDNFDAGLESHARVQLVYEATLSYCGVVSPANKSVPAGASVSYRGGSPWYSGRRALTGVETFVKDAPNTAERIVRRVRLQTTSACPANGGSYRSLDSITITDPLLPYEPAVAIAPPISFEYGAKARQFGGPTKQFNTWFSAQDPIPGPTLSWGRTHGFTYPPQSIDQRAEATIDQTLIDFDGDGRLDLLRSTGSGACSFEFYSNDGASMSNPVQIGLPDEGLFFTTGSVPGLGEGCSLSARRTLWSNFDPACGGSQYGTYLDYRFIDMNRDGLPDLVTSIRVDGQYINTALASGQGYAIPGISTVLGLAPFGPNEGMPQGFPLEGQCKDLYGLDGGGPTESLVPSCPGGVGCGECTYSDMSLMQSDLDLAEGYTCGVSNTLSPDSYLLNFGGCNKPSSLALERNGHFPWMVYYNTGGNLDLANPQRIWSPIALDPAGAESSIGSGNGTGIMSSDHAVFDITGDGIVDAIVDSTDVGFEHWFVFPGQLDDATGAFAGFAEEPQWWTVPNGAKMSGVNNVDGSYSDGSNLITTAQIRSTTQLVDMNADGLPDLVRQRDVNGIEVALNMGSGFCAFDGELGPEAQIDPDDFLSRTGYDNTTFGCRELDANNVCKADGNNAGYGYSLSKIVDVDGDGLPDFYDAWNSPAGLHALGGSAIVKMSAGGGGFEQNAHVMTTLLPREIEVQEEGAYWAVLSDFMDIDGDGLEDVVTAGASSLSLQSDDTSLGQPLRLLNRIANGQGLVTDVEYQHYNDPSVAIDSIGQTRMPSHLWVVSKVTTSSQLDAAYNPAPASEVELRYGDVVYNEDHRGRHGFRGFSSIETSSIHAVGATTGFAMSKKNYAYDQDWSGRLAETVVFADGFEKAVPHSIETITYQELLVLAGASRSYAPYNTYYRRCELGLSYEACAAKGYDIRYGDSYLGLTATGTTGGSVLAHKLHQRLTYKQGSPFRLAITGNILYSDTDKYWYYDSMLYRAKTAGGWAWDSSSKVLWTLDATKTYILHKGVYGTTNGVFQLWYDRTSRSLDTGLVTVTQDPEDRNSVYSVDYSYSGLMLMPDYVTNEVGQTASFTRDNGTGAVLETTGPNPLECDITQDYGMKTDYDSLGRPTAVYELGCNAGSAAENLVSTVQYVDFEPIAGTPAHVITTSFLDLAGATTESTTYIDGAGRTIRTETNDGTATPIVSTWSFNARGLLERYEGVNPSTAIGSSDLVDTSYEYDSVGRATGLRQGEGTPGRGAPVPGASAWSTFVGVDIDYGFDGVNTIKTTSEHVPTANVNSPTAETITYSDFFGRLVQVSESLGGSGYANTYYEYDGNDNLSKVTDADGVVTEMEHGWASRRLSVTRGERVWTYAYDKNGNMVMETSPNDIGETVDNLVTGAYSSSTVYDELDRPTSRVLAIRGLSLEQREDYDSETVSFEYDNCINGIGQLCRQTLGSSLDTSYVYDYAGHNVETSQTASLPESVADLNGDADSIPDFTVTRTSYAEYNLAGAVTEAWLADRANKSDATHLSYSYDALGAPDAVTYHAPGGDVVTTVTRNKAQLVTGQTVGCLSTSWQYDHLGRVFATEVERGSDATSCTSQNGVLFAENLTYFDTSEVETHDVYRGVSIPDRHFQYMYDAQHQLVGATNGSEYNVGFAYTNAGRIAYVDDHPTGTAIAGRAALDYTNFFGQGGAYGDGSLVAGAGTAGADEHAPVDLVGAGLSVHYAYDFSGNVSSRQEDSRGPATTWAFEYDGADQQREVVISGPGNTDGREIYYYDSGGERYMAVTYDTAAANVVPTRIRVWMGGAEIWFAPSTLGTEVDTEYGHFGLGASVSNRVKHIHTSSTTVDTSAEASFHNGLQHLMGSVDWDTGIASAAFVYGPYGEILDSAGSETETHLRRFNGKEADQLSRLNYYGYRYYDPLSLTWTQADPLYLRVPDLGLGNPREMSLYAFSMNNPVRYVDPDGLQAVGDVITLDSGEPFTITDVVWTIGEPDPWAVGRENNQGAYALSNAAQARANAVWYSGGVSKKKRGSYGWDWDGYQRMANQMHRRAANDVLGAVFCNSTSSCLEGAAYSAAGGLLGRGLRALSKTKFAQKLVEKVGALFTKTKCFAAGTLVETANGLRPIEEIGVGDLVWSRDDESGEEGWKPVAQLFVTPNKQVLDLGLIEADGDAQELLVTAEHPLWTADGWTTVGELAVGEFVWARGGWAEVFSVARTGEPETVYNFEVEDFHTYFVGEGGIWAHNSCYLRFARDGSTGALRLSGKIPDRGELAKMSREALVELAEMAQVSLRTRVDEMARLGPLGGHGKRIGQERQLLKNIWGMLD